MDVDRLRSAVRGSRIEWQRHALERMTKRDIPRSAARETLLAGELIEDYPDGQPFPSGLLLGWAGARPIHVLAALDAGSGRVFVITVYEPDLMHFEPDFRTRRRL